MADVEYDDTPIDDQDEAAAVRTLEATMTMSYGLT